MAALYGKSLRGAWKQMGGYGHKNLPLWGVPEQLSERKMRQRKKG